MTSTSFNVGLGESSRNSSKVLKPPGGGSSDIFGTGEAQQSPRKVKQYMASNVILSDDAPASSGPGSSASSTTSNGSAPETPSSPTRNGTATANIPAAGEAGELKGRNYQMQSHFSLGYDSGSKAVDSPKEGDVQDGNVAVREGNPVTGEGYAQQNGQAKSNGQGPAAPRSRVPPGGYSSGLW